jgi:adenine-specific DNA-methyltransferase
MPKKPASEKQIESFVHDDASRRNIPPAEFQTMVRNQEKTPIQVAYERRNPDLDPQLIWRGKNLLDESPLVVNAPPLYIQEKIHPKVLIDDLKRRSKEGSSSQTGFIEQMGLFDTIKGDGGEAAKTEFYQHDQNWSNRMILGDSLQVMSSLAEREGLRGQVQCIYFDPPYGIKFNSNFQWSTASRDVKDGKSDHITREPEQVKAFRDTWRDGIHSYLAYFRDRIIVARDLLADSGSLFVQIGDENVHRIRAVMDEVFGETNFAAQISVNKTSGLGATLLAGTQDFILWYAKCKSAAKFRRLYTDKMERAEADSHYQLDANGRLFTLSDLSGQNNNVASCIYTFQFHGRDFPTPKGRQWKTTLQGLERLARAGRVQISGRSMRYKRFADDMAVLPITDTWSDIGGSVQSRNDPKIYVVQTGTSVMQRCILMTSDPGDLVLDPTCGSGTTATVAEQWGRRWITIDTSRVALALARARIMGARYPYFLLADSQDGKIKQAEFYCTAPSSESPQGNIRQGFVYDRVPQVTLQSFSKNSEIDVIWECWQAKIVPLQEKLNAAIGKTWREWEIPFEADALWADEARKLHEDWLKSCMTRQQEIDRSVAAKAEFEYLYDKPFEDKSKVRVAGPFTVESLSPHRTMIVNDDDTISDPHKQAATAEGATEFGQMILNTLRVAGVQQAHKQDRISFESLDGWPGVLLAGKGSYRDADGTLKTAGIFIGPEFGTVTRVDLVEAARECADAGFNVLISCAFNYEAQSTEFDKLGPIPVLKARMNADLHMQQDLANSGKGNLFVIFGEPDIDILDAPDDQIQVKINGVDVFDPSTGEVRSDEPDNIACWFIDSDYNGESFFVRQAYFLGQNDPYKSLKTSLKAEIDQEAWESLNSDISVPFTKPSTGRIAVKVINHLGDEVMKVYRIQP